MKPEVTFRIVMAALEEAGIEYMVTGSFASNLHGMPRTTQDVDIVIEVSPSSLDQFLKLVEPGFYVSRVAAQEALRHQRMFNIIHLDSGFKVDLIVRKNREYARQEFQRRERATFLDRQCWFASPEDTILSKLEWSKLGESLRQFNDALGVAQVQHDKLDWGYLARWAHELGLDEELRRLREKLTLPEP